LYRTEEVTVSDLEPSDFDDQHQDRDQHDAAESFGSPVADRVFALLSPIVATLGAEIVDVQWAGGTLRVVPDKVGGIGTDELAEINRLISPILDQEDPIPGRYTLEVSSPGVERALRLPTHFRRAVGESVVVKQIPGVEPRRLRGVLESMDGDQLTLSVVEIDGVDLAETERHDVSLADVDSARTHFEWGPTPKIGGGGKRQKKSKKQKNPQPKRSEEQP
jgi:ribosome maturation factor RimP